ncbi:MAG: hypothetical protein AAF329_24235, partial [Cyanobacteria bacterium P01_A01_bin.17]
MSKRIRQVVQWMKRNQRSLYLVSTVVIVAALIVLLGSPGGIGIDEEPKVVTRTQEELPDGSIRETV